MQLLIKDPEIASKTWTLEAPAQTTVAALIKAFLSKRTDSLNHACLLRVFYGTTQISDYLTRSLESLGVREGYMLHTTWSVVAGHISQTCANCQLIANSQVPVGIPFNVVSGGGVIHQTRSVHDRNAIRTPPPAHKAEKEKETPGKSAKQRDSRKPGGGRYPAPKRDHANSSGMVQSMPAGETMRELLSVNGTAAARSLSGVEGAIGAGASPIELIRQLQLLVTSCAKATDITGNLERLSALHTDGHISLDEFQRAKAKLLD